MLFNGLWKKRRPVTAVTSAIGRPRYTRNQW
jgi:hypothetical protein